MSNSVHGASRCNHVWAFILVVGCATSLSFVAENAMAETQSFFYTGVVSEVAPELAAQFQVGDPISGSYAFETTTDASAAGNGSQTYVSAVSEFDVKIGDYLFSMSGVIPGDIVVADDINGGIDQYQVVGLSTGGLPINGLTPVTHAIQLTDSTGSVFSSDALTALPVDVSAFDDPSMLLAFGDGTSVALLEAQLATIQVPEPDGILLSGVLACFLLATICRRR